jgi:hypothetical protein
MSLLPKASEVGEKKINKLSTHFERHKRVGKKIKQKIFTHSLQRRIFLEGYEHKNCSLIVKKIKNWRRNN